MTVKVLFECGGCFAKAEGTSALTREFMSISGKRHGFGSYQYSTPQEVAPDGWIAFDPNTCGCYCPKCWSEIDGAKEGER